MPENKKHEQQWRYGCLPENAPLANPYVPFQMNNAPKYDSNDAVIRGTLFPGLDLPFMGMVNKSALPLTPLTEIQTLDFVIQELALYLDTHSDDKEAFEMYKKYQKMYKEGIKKYESMYGPLSHCGEANDGYKWLCDPWPWEYAKNREV